MNRQQPLSVWPTLSLGIYLRRPRPLPFPLDDPRCRTYARGRHALCQGVSSIALEPGSEVLVPAYHHGSEVEALLQAGLHCRFYGLTEQLEPEEGQLLTLMTPSTAALVVTHYLGFPQDVKRWRRWCDDHHVLMIEDAAQAWLASRNEQPVGSLGDLAIYCLYKSFGVPDGAALTVSAAAGPVLDSAPGQLGLVDLAKRHAASIMSRSARFGRLTSLRHHEGTYSAQEDFRLSEPRSASKVTTVLLSRVVDPTAAFLRREHYEELLEELKDLVPLAFSEVPAGASPMAFPIEVDDRSRVLRSLASEGIDALAFWSTAHPSLRPSEFPRLQSLRDRVVGLPVHHQLRSEDLGRISSAVRQAVR